MCWRSLKMAKFMRKREAKKQIKFNVSEKVFLEMQTIDQQLNSKNDSTQLEVDWDSLVQGALERGVKKVQAKQLELEQK